MDEIQKLLKGELIGRDMSLRKIGENTQFKGKIIDETKNTIIIQTNNNKKRLIKTNYVFGFRVGNKLISIDGRYFNKKPEERIKTKLMKRW